MSAADHDPTPPEPWEWWLVFVVVAVIALLCSSCGLHCECHHSSRPNLAPIPFPTNRVP